jgi:hypothetical protein
VEIRVPGKCEPDFEACRQNSSENSQVPRARNVNDIRLKPFQFSLHRFERPVETEIEPKIRIYREGQPAADQLERFAREGVGAAPADAEEREPAAPGKRIPLTASARDAVYFVKRVRKQGHTRRGSGWPSRSYLSLPAKRQPQGPAHVRSCQKADGGDEPANRGGTYVGPFG